MPFSQRADDPATLMPTVTPGSPIEVAYDKGYSDGIAVAAREVAQLRAEIADMRQELRRAA